VEPIEALTHHESGLTVNVGMIRGGVSMNRVPHEAVVELEMRAPNSYLLDKAASDLKEIVNRSRPVVSFKGGVETKATLDQINQVPVFEKNEATDALVAEYVAAGKEIGCEVLAQSRGGVGDINFIGGHLPSIDGLGLIGLSAHASEWTDRPQRKRPECIFPGSIIPKTLLNYRALLRLLD